MVAPKQKKVDLVRMGKFADLLFVSEEALARMGMENMMGVSNHGKNKGQRFVHENRNSVSKNNKNIKVTDRRNYRNDQDKSRGGDSDLMTLMADIPVPCVVLIESDLLSPIIKGQKFISKSGKNQLKVECQEWESVNDLVNSGDFKLAGFKVFISHSFLRKAGLTTEFSSTRPAVEIAATFKESDGSPFQYQYG